MTSIDKILGVGDAWALVHAADDAFNGESGNWVTICTHDGDGPMPVVRMELFELDCGSCQRRFTAPELVVGDFLLLRSARVGGQVVISTSDEPVLEEVSEIVKNLSFLAGYDDYRIGGAAQASLSMVVDPDIDGSPFVVGALPACPRCGSANIAAWRETDPPELVDVDVPHAEHLAWDALRNSQKIDMIDRSIRDYLSL